MAPQVCSSTQGRSPPSILVDTASELWRGPVEFSDPQMPYAALMRSFRPRTPQSLPRSSSTLRETYRRIVTDGHSFDLDTADQASVDLLTELLRIYRQAADDQGV